MTRDTFHPRAVVFDKDGVLADSEAFNIRSAFEVFRAHGHELVREDETVIVGRHPIDYVPRFAERFGIDAAGRQRIIDQQDVIYNRLWRDEGRLMRGVEPSLGLVRRMGLGVGLATSSSRREVEAFLGQFSLADCFDVTLSLDDVKHAKPDPEIYLLSAEMLGIAPHEMLVVEDSEHGVRAAKAAGASCVAVRSPHVPLDRVSIADAHIASLDELETVLRRRDACP